MGQVASFTESAALIQPRPRGALLKHDSALAGIMRDQHARVR